MSKNDRDGEDVLKLMVGASSCTKPNDFFRNENESVDLLLKEMNQDPFRIDALGMAATAAAAVAAGSDVATEVGTEVGSFTNSPIKPLNFPRVTLTQVQNSGKNGLYHDIKDFNSSSDTCISDEEVARIAATSNSLFARNFELDDSGEIDHSVNVNGPKEEHDFSSVTETPMNSTLDLLKPKQEEEDDNVFLLENVSPSKSIMKKQDGQISPTKKSVAFTNGTPEVHHYPPDKNNSLNLQNTTSDDSAEKLQSEWHQVDKESSEDEHSTPPPAPPIHKSNNISLLTESHNNEDIDIESLNQVKTRLSSFNKLPLSEKLEVILSNSKSKSHNLDEHLTDLAEAIKRRTDTNIQNLFSDIRKQKIEEIENPLNSLSKSTNTKLKSAGSSQSSLQSLCDNNRVLLSTSGNANPNRGIELKDGIKGFSDQMLDSMLPHADKACTRQDENEDDLLMIRPSSSNRLQTLKQQDVADSDNEEFHDSFDTNTEQSILNLLEAHSSQVKLQSSQSSAKANVKVEEEETGNYVKPESPEVEVGERSHHTANTNQEDENVFLQVKSEVEEQVIPLGNGKVDPSSHKTVHSFEIKLPKLPDPANTFDDTSDASNSFEKFSIRDHVNSDWKLEDSNDGDREDNDDYTNNDLTAVNQRKVEKANNDVAADISKKHINGVKEDNAELERSLSHNSLQFEDASDELVGRTLAPPMKADKAIDATCPPLVCVKKEDPTLNSNKDHDDNVLANSSNIAPPEELTLPPVETNNYSSFEEITRQLKSSNISYEESLSAENESDSKPVDFLSIWHSQGRKKRHTSSKEELNLQEVELPRLDLKSQLRLPSSLKQRVFKEVNVMSRRVVSPGFDDPNMSIYLPELSEDSGFGSKFNFSIESKRGNNAKAHPKEETVLVKTEPETTNLLKSLKHDNKAEEFVECSKAEEKKRTPSLSLKKDKSSPFKVPQFQIQRSTSILSPKNQYNDIFDDVLRPVPTIKSHGMKTLPSMDKDDVKKILATKRMISQEDYSTLKLVGNSKKNSIVVEPSDKYDRLQESASIYNVSTESSPKVNRNVLPHLADELLRNPTPILTKDQWFGDLHFPKETALYNGNNSDVERENDGASTLDNNTVFFDPMNEEDAKSFKSNISKNPFRHSMVGLPASGPMNDESDKNASQRNQSLPLSPRKKASPIKIRSPTKIPKVSSESKRVLQESTASNLPHHKQSSSFHGDEILNQKLRDTNEEAFQQDHKPKPSTISVPSIFSDNTAHSKLSVIDNGEALRQTAIHKEWKAKKAHEVGQEFDIEQSLPQERGKLFFRVVGLKNIKLPDISDHKANFSITLDNGVHCIKTSNYEMDSFNVMINKEFELTVGDSLEFILTMKAKYDKPKGTLMEMRERKVVKSKNRLSRMFGSKDIITTTKFVPCNAKDSWVNKCAQDGSFARAYVDLSQYEDKINGKICTFDLACFNEWETIPNKLGTSTVKRQPYRIGQLEVKMLFIPRSAPNEILPTSIKSAHESISDLRVESTTKFEGYLHQEGGDCDIWKKRYFKLEGTSLIAHSEFSHKTRAKINLSKVVDILYIEENEVEKFSTKLRNFSDGLIVPHSFKIKFANGEVIDFGAPNEEEKLQWVTLIEHIILRNRYRRQPWVKMMLENIEKEEFQEKEALNKKETLHGKSFSRKIY